VTAPAITADGAVSRRTPEERRAIAIGGVLVGLAVFVFWAFGLGVESGARSTFNLSLPGERIQGLVWQVDSRWMAFAVTAILGYLGGMVLRRSRLSRTNLALAVGMALFALAFLTWAATDNSFSLVGMLRSTVLLSVPVILGALTGLMCEQVAVVNIAIEGQLLTAAFVATILGSAFGVWIGLIGAVLTGAILGAVLAVLAIRFKIDQIIAGVVINIFALGLTSFLTRRVLAASPNLNSPGRLGSFKIPLLGDIPIIGTMFFDHSMFVYATFVLVLVIHLGLYYTRWGLRSRSVGEHPKAADTVGIDVYRVRYRNVILGGLIAGFGGAFLTLSQVSRFEENLTAGIGFIGLAAMIFGRWRPLGALGAGLVFGFARALQQKLGILGTPIPSEFISMTPYLVTIIVVAGVVGRARPPAADGQPYVKE
jgi:simple sugar transport system permease protein